MCQKTIVSLSKVITNNVHICSLQSVWHIYYIVDTKPINTSKLHFGFSTNHLKQLRNVPLIKFITYIFKMILHFLAYLLVFTNLSWASILKLSLLFMTSCPNLPFWAVIVIYNALTYQKKNCHLQCPCFLLAFEYHAIQYIIHYHCEILPRQDRFWHCGNSTRWWPSQL